MTEGNRTPMLDAVEELGAAAGMCGFVPGEMAILSNELFDRLVVEFSYRGEVARARQMIGPGGVEFLALDFLYIRIYRPMLADGIDRVIGAGES